MRYPAVPQRKLLNNDCWTLGRTEEYNKNIRSFEILCYSGDPSYGGDGGYLHSRYRV